MIYYVRHGETDFNLFNVSQGQLNTSLNKTGLKQAEEAAEKLKNHKFDIAISSPLNRATQTAEYILKFHNLELKTDKRLLEVGKGTLEGTKNPQWLYDEFFKDPHKFKGETDEDVYARVRDFLKDLEKYKGKNILIVGHGEVLKYLRNTLSKKMEDKNRSVLTRTENYAVVKNGHVEEIEF